MTDHPDIVERLHFEVWFADSRRNRGAKKRPSFEQLSDGTYADDHTQRHWWTWQTAQRQAAAEITRLRAEAEALRKDKATLLENLEQMLRQFTKTPSSYKDSDTRCKAHAAIAATKEQQA